MDPHFDEDALAVDDPRRDYDFADFMDSWRLRSIKDRRLPPFELGQQTSVRIGRPTRPVSKHDLASGVDIQGIRWEVIGPLRGRATKARNILHHSPASMTTEARDAKRQRRQGKHYQFRSFNPAHKAKVSHYQLRNVLGATSRNEVFYATGSQVKRTSLACPDLEQTVMDLSKPQSSNAGFRVTCLSASPRHTMQNQGILVAGGFFGEYALCNVDSADNGAVSEGFVTHAYNGLVTHIHTYANRRSGLPQAAFCSNDRMLRLMDVPSLRFTDEFAYEHAINCASTSPDGRLRVLVGDSQETLITNAETGQTLVTLREHNDHGFACDWSPDGIHIATAAQDGGVLIWDARNWSKPCKSWASSTSCARSVQWTDSGTLVVAENDDIVRVYDGAKGEQYQEINFFGSIAGVALVDGGEELVVANADKTVGGLLSFEMTPQGFGESGAHGRQVEEIRGWGSVRGVEATSRIVADIVV
ncbi:hypothetical protein PRZ48_009792 [Zasmidium cellare]|uniref:WD40 repeat-like protein n=1 Tax=Zasmidium cellare TaxID=395010 RepID=A0ABR0ECP8_ZASCE|nr:hypothetical protein PRZ48_009792 [Zasmidium cellare]